mmetsp:Transcript_3065/g.8101  ORF Transcript_3065/g.8101 Transcript_3065/m.8101 type:complete len:208 (-) Transcript_3065:155-778(-)
MMTSSGGISFDMEVKPTKSINSTVTWAWLRAILATSSMSRSSLLPMLRASMTWRGKIWLIMASCASVSSLREFSSCARSVMLRCTSRTAALPVTGSTQRLATTSCQHQSIWRPSSSATMPSSSYSPPSYSTNSLPSSSSSLPCCPSPLAASLHAPVSHTTAAGTSLLGSWSRLLLLLLVMLLPRPSSSSACRSCGSLENFTMRWEAL